MTTKNVEVSVDGTGAGAPVIALNGITKIYHLGLQQIVALNDVSVEFLSGDFTTIQGPSGCGKSTLLNMCGLVDRPSSGDVVIAGRSTRDLKDDDQAWLRANHIGFVFQFYNLTSHLDTLDNVAMAPGAAGVKDSKKRKEMALKVLKRVGLEDRLHNMPSELSGGEQQRVAIARAMVNNPDIIIADEPTGDLDTETGQKIMNLFKELNENDGRTIIVVTHDLNVASMGNRRIKMKDGRIVSQES